MKTGTEIRRISFEAGAQAAIVGDLALREATHGIQATEAELFSRHQHVVGQLGVGRGAQLEVPGQLPGVAGRQAIQRVVGRGAGPGTRSVEGRLIAIVAAGDIVIGAEKSGQVLILLMPSARPGDAHRVQREVGDEASAGAGEPYVVAVLAPIGAEDDALVEFGGARQVEVVAGRVEIAAATDAEPAGRRVDRT